MRGKGDPAGLRPPMEPQVSLLQELKRRRVFRTVLGYGVVAIALLQIVEPVMHGLHWPEAVLSYVVVVLAVGFPVVVALAWIFDVNAWRIERTAPGRLRGLRASVVLAAVGALASAPVLAWYLVKSGPVQSTLPARVAPQPAPSIAVLPLLNLSSDKEQEYFSDGLSEELLNLLAKVPGLRVAARTSAFAFKGKNEDVSAIARKLHVATILEGSVRKSGDQIRITTQLVNAADGYQLWSETYERKLTDVFALQDEIARSVVGALKLKLLQPPTSSNRRTSSPEAFNQYLLGTQFLHRSNLVDFRRAKQAYEKAVVLDPGYAAAWAGLSMATFWVADSAESLEAVTAGQDQAAADKAIAIAPGLPDGYQARGFVRVPIQWDWAGARADLLHALALKPDDPDALSTYAYVVLRATGQLPEAVSALRRAVDLDPLNARLWSMVGNVLVLSGQLAAARDAFDRSLEISPEQSLTPFNLGLAFLLEGRPAEANAASARSTNEVFRLQGAAMAAHDLGHARESQRQLDDLIARFSHVGAYQIAEVYAWRGQTDRAFAWLDRARVQRDAGLTLAKVDVMLRKLHGDPRFATLLRSIDLPVD